jgi:hypothetical protein
LTLFIALLLGTLEPLGWASKLYSFDLLRPQMDVLPLIYYATSLPYVAGLPHLHHQLALFQIDSCRYIAGLPLHRQPYLCVVIIVFLFVIIIFLHHLRHHHRLASVPAELLPFSFMCLDHSSS